MNKKLLRIGKGSKNAIFVALLAEIIITSLILSTAVEHYFMAFGQSLMDQPATISQYADNERSLLKLMRLAGSWSSSFITHSGNTSIAIFLGPDNVKQPQENKIDQIAKQFGFETSAYEYTAEGRLIIILFSHPSYSYSYSFFL